LSYIGLDLPFIKKDITNTTTHNYYGSSLKVKIKDEDEIKVKVETLEETRVRVSTD